MEAADYRARVERIMLIEVEAFDLNCTRHIWNLKRMNVLGA
ncbi:MAG TPA: hypothetical protein VF104_07025 [Burkholderiales bacterium]